MIRNLSLIILTVLFPVTVWTNPMPKGSSGRTPFPVQYFDELNHLSEDPEIEMTGEIVEINENGFTEYPSFMPESPPFRFREAKITGKYRLRNTTGNVVDRLVMFPVPNIFMEGISDFKAEIDGRKTEFTRESSFKTRGYWLFYKDAFSPHALQVMSRFNLIYPCDIDPKMISLAPLKGNVQEIRKKLEAVKEMRPEDRDEIFKSIMDDFYRTYTNDNGAGFDYSGGSVSLYWFRIRMGAHSGMNLTISYKTIIGYKDSFKYTYILKTGKYWKGRIGKSVVRIRTAFPAKSSGYTFSPQISGIAKDGVLEYVFKDFEPNFDINIEFEAGKK